MIPSALLDDTSLRSLLGAYPAPRYVVAYSGGVDSHSLLHLLATAADPVPLSAVYVNHGLSPQAAAWGVHCRRVCRGLNVDFSLLRVDARPGPRESREDAARRARYQALADFLQPGEVLLTAQHQDDQAETLLLQLLRGAGPHGLAAMPVAAPLGRGRLLRPLLDVTRGDILAYARGQGLCWVEDDSNADTSLDRNFLRHEVMPLLRTRWPAAGRTLSRAARRCAEAAELLDEQGEADVGTTRGSRPGTLSVTALKALPDSRRRNLLRHWLRQQGLPLPGEVKLRQALDDLLTAAGDRNPRVAWKGAEVRRYRDDLHAMPPLMSVDTDRVWDWPAPFAPLDLPGVGRLYRQAVVGRGLRADVFQGCRIRIGLRRGGERFRPVGRAHSQALKKRLQEAGIPPWRRERLPLVYVDGELAAVVGLGVSADFACREGETGWWVCCDTVGIGGPSMSRGLPPTVVVL